VRSKDGAPESRFSRKEKDTPFQNRRVPYFCASRMALYSAALPRHV
jgi:hypothetical protein